MRKRVVGIMGGAVVDDATAADAERLGRLVAEHGWVLLTGGHNAGVMAAASRGAKAAGGLVIAVLPGNDRDQACPHADIAIATGMGDARNVVNVRSSDLIIACPGSAGTLSEVALALKNGTPVVLLHFDPGPAVDSYRRSGLLAAATTPEDAIHLAARRLD